MHGYNRVWLLTALAFVVCVMASGCSSWPFWKPQTQEASSARSSLERRQQIAQVPGVEVSQGSKVVTVYAEGSGVEPAQGTLQQRRLLAKRSAVVTAYRNLAERVSGVMLNSRTKQKMTRVEKDEIHTRAQSFVKGAQVLSVEYKDGMATANVKVDIPANRLL